MVSPASDNRTIVSSPGKVLLAGGYLVLDRAFSGVVVATSSRFYSVVSPLSSTSGSNQDGTERAIISVRAGQFPREASTWIYALSVKEDELVLQQINEDKVGKNKFIYISLLKTLEVAYENIVKSGKGSVAAAEELIKRVSSEGDGLDIVVLADNDFYSQREQLSNQSLPARLSSLPSLQPFTPLPRPIPQTNKTGLGSSAALVTSLTASVLCHLGVVSLSNTSRSASAESTSDSKRSDDLGLVHSLAQFAHCLAQGKVGSGFDVSSAVFGTHLYTRFSPSILTPLMDRPLTCIPLLASSASSSSSSYLLEALDHTKWDSSTKPFRLPRGLRLLLADVDAGTDTPSFVGKVLEWRKNNPDQAGKLWVELDSANMKLEGFLTQLVAREGDADYEESLRRAAAGRAGKQENKQSSATSVLVQQVRETLHTIRGYLRAMSDASRVPIEPPEQTRLLDASSDLEGVIGGGVPGGEWSDLKITM
ncbi:phosphomevalonate kinase [Kwoniella heveanensis BCC8398]|uniref:Phosphomevalonate kinase n=1 Tax=Kwoniella heveanensis BCC8398 TaxID=1296120 RepID=A0A1B9GYA8_9TREE|nr:phosphomevalonate kinase [Kwoniella heveanensis BCC8398]